MYIYLDTMICFQFTKQNFFPYCCVKSLNLHVKEIFITISFTRE